MATTSIFAGTANDEVGSFNNGLSSKLAGKVLWTQVRDAGVIVSFFDARTQTPGATTVIDSVGNTWTLQGTAEIVAYTTAQELVTRAAARRSNIVDYDEDGIEQRITGLAIIGEGEGNDMKLIFAQATGGTAPLWEAKYTAKDEGDEDVLLSRGTFCLDENANVIRQYTLTLDPELEPVAVPSGPSIFTVSNGRIIDPTNQVELRTAGMNAAVGVPNVSSWANPGGVTAWTHEGFPAFDTQPDIWPGDDNNPGSGMIFPGGVITGHDVAWSQALTSFTSIPDRAYAMNGIRSATASAHGIDNPPDYWNTRIARVPCTLRSTGSVTNESGITKTTTIPGYIASIQQLGTLGLIVAAHQHSQTRDVAMEATVVSDPLVDVTTLADTEIRDGLEFLDALVLNCDPATTWIGCSNEPFTTARDTTYDDFVVTQIRRIRGKGWQGIITVPMANYSGDLGPMANGEYDSLMDRLDTHGLGWGLVWEWHNYGVRFITGQPNEPYSYAQIDADLAAVRNGTSSRRYAVWLAEYGQATPVGTGGSIDAQTRDAMLSMSTNVNGPALAVKYPHICATWWNATGDHTWDSSFSLTYGEDNYGDETGPDPNNGTNPGTMPFWDIDGTNLDWLTPGGLAHWNMAHSVAALPAETPVQQQEIIPGSYVRLVIADKSTQVDSPSFWIGRKRTTLSKEQDEIITLEVTQ